MKKVLPIFLFLIFIACQDTVLLQDLEQRDANEAMVLLSKNNIKARKASVEKQQKTSWVIKVALGDAVRAREILVAYHLPREKEMGLSGICKDAGLIPTPKTEKCREMLAIKGEIINTLESLPGVVDVEVVINVPDVEAFPNENAPVLGPRASIVVQIEDEGVKEVITEEKIQQFVANAVTGLDLRDVAVIISRASSGESTGVVVSSPSSGGTGTPEVACPEVSEAEEPMVLVAGLKMTLPSAKKFKILGSVLLFLFVILAAVLIFTLFQLARYRERVQGGVPAVVNENQEETDTEKNE